MSLMRHRRAAITRRIMTSLCGLLVVAYVGAGAVGWLIFSDTVTALAGGAPPPEQVSAIAWERLSARWPLIGLVLLAVLLLAWSLSRRLSRQLFQLRELLDALGRGESLSNLPKPRGELGSLITSFNNMANELLRSSQELQARNRTLSETVRGLEARLQLVQILASTLDRDQLLGQFASTLRAVFGFEKVCIALPERERLLFYDGAAVAEGAIVTPQPVALDERSAAGLAALRREPQLFPDIVPQGLLPPPTNGAARAEIAVPVLHEGVVLAVLDVQSDQPYTLGGEQLSLLRSIAAQFAPALTNSGMFRAEQVRRQLAEAIYHVAHSLSVMTQPDDVPTLLLDQLHRVLAYDRATLLSLEGRQLAVVAARGWEPPFRRIDVNGHGPLAHLLREAQPLLLRDVGEGQQVVLPGGWGAARSCLGAPLVRQGKVVGTLLIESDEPDRYGIEEQRAASALAAQAAVALENTRLYAEAQERTRYLKVINEIILAVTTSQDWRGMLNTTIQQIRRLVSCDYAAIALYHAESDAFSIETLYDARGTDELHGTMLPAEHTPWQLAYNAGQPVYQSELSRSAFRRDQELAMRGLRSSVVVPIQGDMGKLGTLNLASRYAGNFSSDQIRLLVELAPYIASALNYLRRQQAEQELVGAREQITVSERMRVESEKLRTIGQIASGVAHDFNNLLAGILGNTQLLLLDEADDERRSLLKVVEQAARDGAETVRRLQTYARMDQHTPLVETRMDLLVSDALELTRPRWRDLSQGRGVTINVVRELHKVPIVAGRPAELREVLTNLIINAVDAMPHGGTLTVGTRAETAEDGLPVVVVSVGDTGCGMQPEVVERIFEPFFTTKGQNGTGLGLPVSKGIIEHHGGTLSVTSAPDQGSRFIIRLPVSDGIAVALPPETPRPIPQSRILVVEDESIVRDALVRLLKSWGHEVSEASGGQQGIDRFAAGRFDMVITDLGMPDRSGWEVLGVVKARDRRVATLLLTGWGNELDKDEARVRGADQLISKPFNQDDLRRALSNALTR